MRKISRCEDAAAFSFGKAVKQTMWEIRKISAVTEAELERLTGWMYHWWGKQEGYEKEAIRCYLIHSMQRERLPQTFGLFVDENLVGMYQFTQGDLFVRPDLYPWLANVYVEEAYRKQGYGKHLLESVQENAKKYLSGGKLYLFTTHIGLYEKFGWEFMEELDTFLPEKRIQRLYRLLYTK